MLMFIITVSTVLYFIIVSVTGMDHSSLPFDHFPSIQTLSPTVKITDPNQRLLFIGDVHGNYDELIQLLKDHQYWKDGELITDPQTLQITLLGDFLTKGPDSLKVADFILDHKESVGCVLGNNEIMVLLSILNPNHKFKIPLKFTTEKDFLPENDKDDDYWDVIKPRSKHYKVAQELGILKLAQLAQHCSVVKKFDLKLSDDLIFGVHAGLLPGDFLLDKRGGDSFQRIPSIISLVDMKYVNYKNWYEVSRDIDDVKHGIRWYKLWEEYYAEKPPGKNQKNITVIYGHDAHNGLTLHEHTKGLDSACAKGGYLSSLEYEFDPETGHYNTHLRQVPCNRV